MCAQEKTRAAASESKCSAPPLDGVKRPFFPIIRPQYAFGDGWQRWNGDSLQAYGRHLTTLAALHDQRSRRWLRNPVHR